MLELHRVTEVALLCPSVDTTSRPAGVIFGFCSVKLESTLFLGVSTFLRKTRRSLIGILRLASIVSAMFFILASCNRRAQADPWDLSSSDVFSDWSRRSWVAKAARILHYGDPVSRPDEMNRLLAQDDSNIVDTLMADPRFGDAILDFNLYFLGSKPPQLFTTQATNGLPNKTYVDAVVNAPQAVSAARNLLTGGDYFSLFDAQQPVYIMHTKDPLPPADDTAPPTAEVDIWNHLLARSDENFDALIRIFDGADQSRNCEVWDASDAIRDSTESVIYRSGLAVDYGLTAFYRWHHHIDDLCRDVAPAAEIQEYLRHKRALVHVIFEWAQAHRPERYRVQGILDLATVPASDLDPEWFGHNLTFMGFWNDLQGSSTNFNRSRAAYILKTYFCDDLTPVNIVLPSSHAGGAHASDPSCQACHYKLDPMAGFFRYRGYAGNNYRDRATFEFDDGVTLAPSDRRKFFDSWKAPAGAGRTWNVGYIRSSTDSGRNTYAPEDSSGALSRDPVADLFQIVKTAPEVRRCLTRRLAEYFIGTHQAFDGQWLKELTDQFAVSDTAAAAKNVIKTMIMSNAFRQQDPNPNQCYDPLQQPDAKVPCEVAFIMRNNCTGACHESFDLTDPATLQEIDRRLKSSDPDVRMPYLRDMADIDRVKLIKWLEAR